VYVANPQLRLGLSLRCGSLAHDAFISYSDQDKLAADAACAVLESAGIRCWIAPRDTSPGAEWGAATVDAIDHSAVMVLIFSSNANESPQIRREVERAVSKGVMIVPVRIERGEPTRSLAYFIAGVHRLDALTPPLENHLQRLAISVKAFLRTASAHPTRNVGKPRPTLHTPPSLSRQPRRRRQFPEKVRKRRSAGGGERTAPWARAGDIATGAKGIRSRAVGRRTAEAASPVPRSINNARHESNQQGTPPRPATPADVEMNPEADSREVEVDRFEPGWDGEDSVSSETSTH
jgi:hypothetical protein